jgi:hypothetical protein
LGPKDFTFFEQDNCIFPKLAPSVVVEAVRGA